MISFISEWFAHAFLGAAALLALGPTATTTPSTLDTAPTTPEEMSQNLHDKITDLRAEIERTHLESTLPLNRTLSLGEKGDDVLMLQRLLASLNIISTDDATGYYGPSTKSAIAKFQADRLFPATGVVDRQTLDELIAYDIHNLDLGSIYFDEEAQLLAVATSSRQLVDDYNAEPVDTTDTSSNTTTAPTNTTVSRSYNIAASNYSFFPVTITANKGDTVNIHFTVTSGTHSLVIDAYKINTGNLTSGKSANVTIAATSSGNFQFYSSVSNDKSKGMVGTLTISP